MKWILENGKLYPQCSECLSYPLNFVGGFMGSDKKRYYLLECPECGRVYVRKTNIRTLRNKALKRRLL